jgi:hypothetical protein
MIGSAIKATPSAPKGYQASKPAHPKLGSNTIKQSMDGPMQKYAGAGDNPEIVMGTGKTAGQ